MKKVFTDPAAYRKFIYALLGALAVAVAEGLLPGAVSSWIAVATAFLTALGVYAARNDAPKGGNNDG